MSKKWHLLRKKEKYKDTQKKKKIKEEELSEN